MRQTQARGGGLGTTLRRRWWVFPLLLILVLGGFVLRAMTAPLAVNASVSDGDHAVVRTSTVLLTFNQDMDVDSVLKGIRITPLTPYDVVVSGPRSFEVKPWLQPDTTYEYISEFGIPRLTAVYWHPPSSLIGPVRSCRLITVQLEQMYRGMIYCSGANDYVLGQVWKWPNVVYDYAYWLPLMYRTGDRAAPHNVIARPDQITAHTASANIPALNYDIAPAHPDTPLPGATPATSVTIPQHGAVWRYDPNSREYLKWQ